MVDCNKTIAQTLTWVFAASGNDVRTEHSGEAALVTAAESKPDLAVVEFILTGMNGRAPSLQRIGASDAEAS